MERSTATLSPNDVLPQQTRTGRSTAGAGSQKPKSAEMHPGPGFRLKYDVERPDAELVARFGRFDTPSISDHLNRLFTMSTAIQLLTDPTHRILGPACTVKVFPGDNLMAHKALDIARPGDILVIDASASTLTAIVGDLVSMKARHRGIAGIIVDGLIRDLPAIRRLGDFPVFARGVTPIGPLHRGPGEVNFPVSAGGIVVNPGDIIAGDLNGVVVIPKDVATTVLTRLEGRADVERDYQAAVARGDFSNAWVDEYLLAAGVRPEPIGRYESSDSTR
jgi:regulator of RNase E activity RraA